MNDQDEVPYIVVEKNKGFGLGTFLGGALIGAAVALLYAPKTGEETQRELKEGMRRLRADAETRFTELRGEMDHRVHRVRDDLSGRLSTARQEVNERRGQAEEAVRVGRGAARRAREDLERRVAESKTEYRERMAARAARGEEVPEETLASGTAAAGDETAATPGEEAESGSRTASGKKPSGSEKA